MNNRLIYHICILPLLLCIISFINPQCCIAADRTSDPSPLIIGIEQMEDAASLLISFRLENGYPADAEEVIKSGTPVEIIYDAELLSEGMIWDSSIASVQIRRTIYYDVIKGCFQIGFGIKTPRVISVRSLDEASQFIFSIRREPIAPLSELETGKRYRIRVRATISRQVDIILPFKPLVAMFSSWGYTTEWYEIIFGN